MINNRTCEQFSQSRCCLKLWMFGSLLHWTSHHLYYYSGILARLAAKHHLNNIAPISDFSADICSVDYVGRDLGGRCPFMSFAPCFGCCVLLLCLLLLCNVMICYVMLCICSMSTTSSCSSCSEGGVIPFLWLLLLLHVQFAGCPVAVLIALAGTQDLKSVATGLGSAPNDSVRCLVENTFCFLFALMCL